MAKIPAFPANSVGIDNGSAGIVSANRLQELAALFLRLGCISFGGPLAHIALMQHEVVTMRQWLTHAEFLDLMGATNLIPGPNSTEMAMHIGQLRAGGRGLLVAGLCFIAPAMLMMLALAALYARYGQLPAAAGLMLGVQPVVVAIVLRALGRFVGAALKGRFTIAIAVSALLLAWAHAAKRFPVDEVGIIFGAAVIGLVVGLSRQYRQTALRRATEQADDNNHTAPPPPPRSALLFFGAAPGLTLLPNAGGVFLLFLKIGSILYGSGYVLLAFLRSDFVERLHWITDRQLIDAVAMGQFTPGPLFTTATFVGFQVAGVSGALAATLGIFLPSFVFVALLAVLLERLQRSLAMRYFLDAVNAASFALMAVVSLQIGGYALLGPWPNVWPSFIFVVAALALWRTRLNAAWLLLGGAICGLAMAALR